MIKGTRDKVGGVSPALAEPITRTVVGAVFLMNVWCAVTFLGWPENFTASFELGGAPGRAIVQAFGILFLMWNATYPAVVWRPRAHRVLFAVILVQQAIGLVGETWLVLSLAPGHAALWATGVRFIVFDGAGLALMLLAYVVLRRSNAR
jgi:hypothetical protein